MYTKLTLDLSDAQAIVAAAQASAEDQHLAVSIAIVDESTYLQHVGPHGRGPLHQRRRCDQKARNGGRGWTPHHLLRGTAQRRPVLDAEDASLYPLEGGLPVIIDGHCIGAMSCPLGPVPQDAPSGTKDFGSLKIFLTPVPFRHPATVISSISAAHPAPRRLRED